jgi:tRNA 2-thiouridine synthesizing protein E
MNTAEDTIIEFHGDRIEFDEHGYLKDITQWSEKLAEHLSNEDGLNLTEDHWEVIKFMRAYYIRYQITPMPKVIVKKLNDIIHFKKYGVKYLYQLFPRTPITHACKYAGIPRPSGCI